LTLAIVTPISLVGSRPQGCDISHSGLFVRLQPRGTAQAETQPTKPDFRNLPRSRRLMQD
jgi:hypothetical protein